MSKCYSLNSAKDADRRTALLGVALAGRNADRDSCLSDEDMAAFVDDVCSRRERRRYLHHLANCEKCYQHWLTLSEIVLAQKEKTDRGGSRMIVRPRYFAWVGSLLAAAASVVLLLNVTREARPPVLHQAMKTEFGRHSSSVVVPQQGERAASTKPGPTRPYDYSSADKAVDGQTSKDDLAQLATIMKMKIQAGKKSSSLESTTAKRKIEVNKRNSIAHFGRHESAGHQHSLSPVRLWFNEVQQGCQTHEANQLFWATQYTLGKQMTSFQSTKEKKFVQELLPLVGKLREPAVKNRAVCKRILLYLDDYTTE